MAWSVRVDTAPIRDFFILFVVVMTTLIVTIIVAFAGPAKVEQNIFSTWNCKDENHTSWSDGDCTGVKLSSGAWSPKYTIHSQPLNRHWYCQVYPFSLDSTEGFTEEVTIYTLVIGSSSNTSLDVLHNDTVSSWLNCPDSGDLCEPFLLYQVPNIDYLEYSVAIKILGTDGKPVDGLADVVLIMSQDSSGFSVLAISLHFFFLSVTIAILCYHLLMMRNNGISLDQWTLEQKLLIALVISLILYNNPFYPIEFLIPGWPVIFFGDFLELFFSMVLFTFWFVLLNKLQSANNEIEWNMYLKPQLALVVLYGIFTSILYAWTSFRDEASPLFGIQDHVTGIQAFFYISSILYVALALTFCVSLVFTMAITNQTRQDLRFRFYFFSLPTLIAIISILVGLFTGTLGPFGRDTPSFVYFMSLYNLYVYVLLWGYWPIDVGLNAQNPTEGTRIFPDATDFKH